MHCPRPSSLKKSRKPCFFKFFFPGLNDKELEVPKAFLKHFDGNYRGNVLLKGSNGNIWRVSLTEKSNGVFLKGGWQTFVKDHCVQVGYCLVFRYYGNFRFRVSIFDTSACEKIDISNKMDHGGYVDYEFDEEENIVGNKGSKHLNTSPLYRDCDGNAVCQNPTGGCSVVRPFRRESKKLGKQNRGKTFSKTQPSQSTENKIEEEHKRRRGSKLDEAVSSKEEIIDLSSSEDLHPRKTRFSPRGHAGKMENLKLSKKSSFTLTNPSFRRFMTKTQLSTGLYVLIPSAFWKDYMPCKKNTNVVLRNLEGKSWTVKCVISNRTLSGGWVAFARDNNLKVGDECVFELVDKLVMQVHILKDR